MFIAISALASPTVSPPAMIMAPAAPLISANVKSFGNPLFLFSLYFSNNVVVNDALFTPSSCFESVLTQTCTNTAYHFFQSRLEWLFMNIFNCPAPIMSILQSVETRKPVWEILYYSKVRSKSTSRDRSTNRAEICQLSSLLAHQSEQSHIQHHLLV